MRPARCGKHLGGKAAARGGNEQRTAWGMNFDSLATLQWGVPTVSEQGRLRRLVRKVLELPPAERQKCCITVGDFTYRRAEIEALAPHPDFSDSALKRAHAAVAHLRGPRSNPTRS